MVLGLTTPTVLLQSGQVSRRNCVLYNYLYEVSYGVHNTIRRRSVIPYQIVMGMGRICINNVSGR